MSLTPFLPPTGGDAGTVFSLLQALSSPKEAEAALKKMVDEQKLIEQRTQELNKATDEQRELLKQNQETLNDVGKLRDEIEGKKRELEYEQKHFNTVRSSVSIREGKVQEREHEVQLREAAVAQLESQQIVRENKLKDRETAVVSKEEKLRASIDAYKQWLGTLSIPRFIE